MYVSEDYAGRANKLDSGEWGVSKRKEEPLVRPAPGGQVHPRMGSGEEFLASIDEVEEERVRRGAILFECSSTTETFTTETVL